MFDIEPQYEAPSILRSLFSDRANADYLLQAAGHGLHMNNPYHNLQHELHVVYWSHVVATNENSLRPKASNHYLVQGDLKALAVASLFHDHNHSGGAERDTVNIQRAIQRVFTRDINLILEDEGINKETVRDLIRVTCFENGAFRRRPRTLLEKSIRDADLMMVYSDPGQHVATGLFYETAGCHPTQYVDRSHAFPCRMRLQTPCASGA